MNFAALDIPDFPVQAVVRNEPSLQGRPVAVVEREPPPYRVFALNEAARKAGAQLGMSRVEVAGLTDLEVRQRSPAAEASADAALLDLARSFSPRFEHVAAGTVVIDLAGLEALMGAPGKIARKLAARARELRLAAHIALTANPDAARVAARGFKGITLIDEGEEAERLGRLRVETLDLSPDMQETLARWGIRTFAELAALPAAELSERLGQEGIHLQTLARGGSLRALVPAEDPLHFEEAMDLEYGVAELEPLAFILGRLLNQLCARLSARGRATQEMQLVLGVDIEQVESQKSKVEGECIVRLSTFDLFAPRLESRTLRLPVPTYDSRLLLKLWMLDLEAHPPSAPVLKLAITAEPTRPRVAQGDLFLPRAPDPQKLELTLARLRGIVGEGKAGSPELLDTYRPDAFRMVPFGSSKAEIRKAQVKSRKSKVKSSGIAALTNRFSTFDLRLSTYDLHPTLRLFRPPLEASVEFQNGRPVWLESRRVRGHILSAIGPWRTSGGWWTSNPWEQDEWDVSVNSPQPSAISRQLSVVRSSEIRAKKAKVESERLYRMYLDLRNGKWFVSGLYD